MHERAPYADALCRLVERVLRDDVAYHQRLEGHYAMVKRAVGTNPRAQAPVRRVTKVGANEPCPCGSGKKYKKCHAGRALP